MAFSRALAYSESISVLYDALLPVVRRVEHGVPFHEALQSRAILLRCNELAMLAAIAHANQRYGGSLSQILEHYTRMLRDRLRMKNEMNALSAEARTSAKAMMLLSVMVAAGIFQSNPDYLFFFTESTIGRVLLIYGSCSGLLGTFVMSRLARIEY